MLAGFVNGLVKGVGKVISNISTGRPWYEHTLGAAAGGFVEGAIYICTFKPAAASYAGAATESILNEAEDYLFQRKELNWDNVAKSIWGAAKNTAVEGTAGYILGETRMGKDIYTEIHKGTFKPQSIKSYFFGAYGIKTTANQIHSNILSTTLDTTRAKFMSDAEKLLTAASTKRTEGKPTKGAVQAVTQTNGGMVHTQPVVQGGLISAFSGLAVLIKGYAKSIGR